MTAQKFGFLLGLAFYTCGQVMIAMGRAFVDGLSPIDFAHWLLLLGALCLLPYALKRVDRLLDKLVAGLLMLGVAAIIGMCVIDFIIWSYEPGPERSALIDHLRGTPSIWWPFIIIGPWFFGVGVGVASLAYWRTRPVGVGLVLLGCLITAVATAWPNVAGNALILIGFGVCFWPSKTDARLRHG